MKGVDPWIFGSYTLLSEPADNLARTCGLAKNSRYVTGFVSETVARRRMEAYTLFLTYKVCVDLGKVLSILRILSLAIFRGHLGDSLSTGLIIRDLRISARFTSVTLDITHTLSMPVMPFLRLL